MNILGANYFHFLGSAPTKSSNTPKGGGFGLAISHPKHSTFTRQNETAAGVALVKAAAAGFTMHADHRLLEDEGGGPQRRRAPELLATKTRTENRPGDDAAPVLLGQRCPATGQPQHHVLHLREPRTCLPSPPPRG